MKLRFQPWLTSDCIRFLNNFFKWYPAFSQGTHLRVLEFGSGNSTLYFLSKSCHVLTIEARADYRQNLQHIAEQTGAAIIINEYEDFLKQSHDAKHPLLHIMAAMHFAEIPPTVFEQSWDIIISDGMARRAVLEKIMQMPPHDALLIIDNAEYGANWGKMLKGAHKQQRRALYREFLQKPHYQHYLFEQPEGRDGHALMDDCGQETPHRWISAVAWHQDSRLSPLMLTHLGLPLINHEGLDNQDLEQTDQQQEGKLPRSYD